MRYVLIGLICISFAFINCSRDNTQNDIKPTEEEYLQIYEGSSEENISNDQPNLELNQQLDFPPKIDLFQFSASVSQRHLYGLPDARMWGWSNDGKVAYSIESEAVGRGGQVINFVILDLITDNVIFELKMDGYVHDDEYRTRDETLYNLYKPIILNALSTHNIVAQGTEFKPFPLTRDDVLHNSYIIDIEHTGSKAQYDWDYVISRYTVLVTADDRRKIIANFNTVNSETFEIYICGYFLSPFENRILVVLAEENWGWGGTELTYRFSGCHLRVGFN